MRGLPHKLSFQTDAAYDSAVIEKTLLSVIFQINSVFPMTAAARICRDALLFVIIPINSVVSWCAAVWICQGALLFAFIAKKQCYFNGCD